MNQIVQQDLRNLLTKYLFDTMSRFWLMTSFCSISLILPLTRLFWATRLEFYEIFIRSKIVERDLSNILKNIFFYTMSRFWPMTSFVDVILLCFTNFTTSSSLWTTQLDFYEISTRIKVVEHDQRNNLSNFFFLIPYQVFDLWRHFALFH